MVLEELGNAQKVRVDRLVKLTVRVKPAARSAHWTSPGDRRGDHDHGQAGKYLPVREIRSRAASG
jgi:hypothetical protein